MRPTWRFALLDDRELLLLEAACLARVADGGDPGEECELVALCEELESEMARCV